MSESHGRWVPEFTVTPAITEAVQQLRALIPRKAKSINIAFSDGVMEYDGATPDSAGREALITLTEWQKAGALLLIATAGYYEDQMLSVYGETTSESDPRMPEGLRIAKAAFEKQVREKLNIEVFGSFFETSLSGSVTVYR